MERGWQIIYEYTCCTVLCVSAGICLPETMCEESIENMDLQCPVQYDDSFAWYDGMSPESIEGNDWTDSQAVSHTSLFSA